MKFYRHNIPASESQAYQPTWIGCLNCFKPYTGGTFTLLTVRKQNIYKNPDIGVFYM